MEKMPYGVEMDARMFRRSTATTIVQPRSGAVVSSDWRKGLPMLRGGEVVLREPRASDAASLFAILTTKEVARFISPPPTTLDGFERFIAWTIRQRAAGSYACFAVTFHGCDAAVGIFQLRQTEADFGIAEWGFAIGSAFWGTGAFQDGAELMINFAFDTIGVHRLEARAAVLNGRGNGALQKVGAVQECLLRKSFLRNGQHFDQALYAILDSDWRKSRTRMATPAVLVH